MIHGAHAIVYSTNADADRAFFRDVLRLPSVDVGDGWLIFGLPPAEVAVHPSERNDVQELYLMSDDIYGFVAAMADQGLSCSPVADQGWGILTSLTLPGGGQLGVYQPRHASPPSVTAGRNKASSKKAGKKKASKKKASSKKTGKKKASSKKAGKKKASSKKAGKKKAGKKKAGKKKAGKKKAGKKKASSKKDGKKKAGKK